MPEADTGLGFTMKMSDEGTSVGEKVVSKVDEFKNKQKLLKEAYKDKDLRNDADESYKWACGGTGAKNMEFRMQVLPEIVSKTNQKISV